jgi:hypothetical protein
MITMYQSILLLLGSCCAVPAAKALAGAVALLCFWFTCLQYRCELCVPIAIGTLCSLCPFFQVTKSTKKALRTQSMSSRVVTSETSLSYWETIQHIRSFSYFHPDSYRDKSAHLHICTSAYL